MTQKPPSEIFPPGAFIREELEGRGLLVSDLAKIMNRPIQTISEIINGKKAITPTTAHELGEAFGTGPEVWLNLEIMWQLSQAENPSGRVRRRAAIYELAPIREMIRRKWIRAVDSPDEIAEELKMHFEVDDLNQLPDTLAAARSSVRGENDTLTPAQWAWCCRSRKVAALVDAKQYRKDVLVGCIHELHGLTKEPDEIRHVPRLLAEAGVRLVMVEHLKHTKLDGAALRKDHTKPVISMSLRIGRIDNFWFTLFHECAHIINEDGLSADSEICKTGEHVDAIEARANQMAAEWLIPKEKLDSFILRTAPLFSSRKIENFASRMGVHPGIVVGQLKFRGALDWTHLNGFQIDIRDMVRQANISDGWGESAPLE